MYPPEWSPFNLVFKEMVVHNQIGGIRFLLFWGLRRRIRYLPFILGFKERVAYNQIGGLRFKFFQGLRRGIWDKSLKHHKIIEKKNKKKE